MHQVKLVSGSKQSKDIGTLHVIKPKNFFNPGIFVDAGSFNSKRN